MGRFIIFILYAFLHSVEILSEEKTCPYYNLCHGVKCGENTRCKRLRPQCSYQCTRDAIVPWLPHTSRCRYAHHGKLCLHNPQCNITNKCGNHICENQCDGCYAACIVNRMNSTFPKNPRVTKLGYRSVEIEWDDIENLNETGEKREYIFQSFISTINITTRFKHRFITYEGQVKTYERKEPRIKIDNLLVHGYIRVAIALKSRRNTILFEISPYKSVITKPIDPVEVERPGEITNLVVRRDEENKPVIEWEAPANIMNSKYPEDKSVEYHIETCKYEPFQQTKSECRFVGVLIGNASKSLQTTADAKYTMYPFNVILEHNKEILVEVKTVALDLSEGPIAAKVTRLNKATIPHPPRRFRVQEKNKGKMIIHHVSWEIPRKDDNTKYIVEYKPEEATEINSYIVDRKNDSVIVTVHNISMNHTNTPELSQISHELGKINQKESYKVKSEHEKGGNNTLQYEAYFMTFEIKDIIQSKNYYLRVAVYKSDNGGGPFSHTVKYTSTESSSLGLRQSWGVLVLMLISFKIFT